jgi:serine/threonine-protein kinase HipA
MMIEITNCPGTLTEGFDTYSTRCLRQMFGGRKVSHLLPYNSPQSGLEDESAFDDNRRQISISGVQEKYSVLRDKNKLRLVTGEERGGYILKPIPSFGSKKDQIPANEHLTMQIAKQVFAIEVAESALIFFKNGEIAYLTKRFDVKDSGGKRAQEDFATLAGRTPQTYGEHYKYEGNYLELFDLMKKYVPAYAVEAPKLLRLLIFNYLFSNGDAHFKNFSLLETELGDHRLSPAYDLLNSRIHVSDNDFALEDGLLPKNLSGGKIADQFLELANQADINETITRRIFDEMSSKSKEVEEIINRSFLNLSTKRQYFKHYQKRLKRFSK